MTTPEAPRWLTDKEAEAWLPLIRIVTILPQVLDRQLRDDAGVSHIQYHILTRLSGATAQRLRMTELAKGLGISVSRLSHAVTTMERNGWVTRSSTDDDRRGQVAILTADGKRLLEAAAPGHVAAVRRAVFDGLTDQHVTQLAAVAWQIVKQLEG